MGIWIWFLWITWVMIATVVVAWGILHEDRVGAWERRTLARIRRWRRDRKIERIASTLADFGLTVAPMERVERRERDAGCVKVIEDYYAAK